jgi:hypothetical protein
MQCKEWDDANSELFKESHDAAVHKISYESKLYELISASLEFSCNARNGVTRIASDLTQQCMKILMKADSMNESVLPEALQRRDRGGIGFPLTALLFSSPPAGLSGRIQTIMNFLINLLLYYT